MKGFTLVELIIVVAIIGILAAVALVDYRATDKRAALHLETQQLVGVIRRAQNAALAAIDVNGTTPAGGWGVYIRDAQTYYLFADNDAPGAPNHGVYNAGDTVTETMTLSPKITLSGGIGTSMVFVPPNPDTYIDGVQSGSATLTLRLADDASVTTTVTVNYFGLVDADE